MAELNTPLTVGDFEIKNRLVMAPLTRARSGESRVPNDLMVEYYQQRANAGLILTEATVIGSKTVGYADTPGLWSQEQAQACSFLLHHAQLRTLIIKAAVGEVAGDNGGNAGGAEQHKGDHYLILNGFYWVDSGENHPRHHARQADDADGFGGIDGGDHRGANAVAND